MEIKTKIISTETIKPSRPTPKSLQKHQLSMLDQLAPPIPAPFLYFYSSSHPHIPNSRKSNHLKNSLSETLSRFYPLAGRLVDNLYVDCNDGGALFAEAETDCHLSQVITNPDPERINKLFCKFDDDSHVFCMTVQATFFRCGGLALGLLISHKIADGLSIVTFANSWSAVARNGAGGTPLPIFDGATHFPPRDIPHFNPGVGFTQEKLATRIFTFPAVKIDALRERYAAVDGGGEHRLRRRPSRVDALSAYLWTRFLFATGRQADPTKTYSIKHAVNLRSRVDPPLSECHFGNINWLSIAKPAAGDGGAELVRKIYEGKKALYEGYAGELKELNVLKELMSEGVRVVSFIFTSLCGFPVYEADFGWGRPIWAVSPGFAHKNVALLTDTNSGGGIEALICLTKSDMEKFEADLQLQLTQSKL